MTVRRQRDVTEHCPRAVGGRGDDPPGGHDVVVAKYDPLLEHLCRADDGPIEMTFAEIYRLVGGLPASAARWPAWWANESARSRHVQARAWLGAGRGGRVRRSRARRVRFSAAGWRRDS